MASIPSSERAARVDGAAPERVRERYERSREALVTRFMRTLREQASRDAYAAPHERASQRPPRLVR